MSDRILELLEVSSGNALQQSHSDELKTLFCQPIVAIARQIVDRMQQVSGRGAPIPIRLSNELVATLNTKGVVRCNPVDAFGLPLSETNQRVAGIRLIEAKLAAVTGARPNALRLFIRHLGLCIDRGKDDLYCFSAGGPGGRSFWGFTWNLDQNTASTDPKATETAELLGEILGVGKDQPMVAGLSAYCPGVFSEFEISRESVGQGTPPSIEALRFDLSMPYKQPDDGHVLIHVRTTDDLQPRIDCGYAGDTQAATASAASAVSSGCCARALRCSSRHPRNMERAYSNAGRRQPAPPNHRRGSHSAWTGRRR
jgi:hypothetical protein